MSKRLAFKISPKSIGKVIREIKTYSRTFEEKCDEVVRRVVEYGKEEAEKHFMLAQYDGERDVVVSVVKDGTTYSIVANGHAVAFIEFGAGVYYNGTDGMYPIQRPPGIVGIGEYGKGQGKKDAWTYQENGVFVTTYGNPANMPMYFASVEIRNRLKDAVREVFGNA